MHHRVTRRFPVAVASVAVAIVVLAAGCGAGDSDDSGADDAGADRAGASPGGSGESCGATVDGASDLEGSVLVPGDLEIAITGPVAFVDGEGVTSASDGETAHDHSGGAVRPGDPHLHYCLAVGNDADRAVAVDAVQVLPAEGEEALALYESESLADAAGEEGSSPVAIAAGARRGFELLVPADAPIGELRHRLAYTLDDPDGPRDLFTEIRFSDLDGG